MDKLDVLELLSECKELVDYGEFSRDRLKSLLVNTVLPFLGWTTKDLQRFIFEYSPVIVFDQMDNDQLWLLCHNLMLEVRKKVVLTPDLTQELTV